MRLIHTADWHLCDKLGRVDRTHDLRNRVEQIADLCETHGADVLLIAGDLFSEHASLDEMKVSLEHLYKSFAKFFERDGTILAVTGNHDREARVELIRQGMRLATPDAGRGFQPGRMYLLNQPFVGTLRTPAGEQTQFVLLPYPTTVRYGLPTDQFRTKDEENRALNNRVANWIAESKEKVDPKLPTVFVGHLHVAGAGLSHKLFKLSEQDDVVFDTGNLGLNRAQYVALGHIHKPQTLPGLPHVRYSGSLDRLHFDEREDEKGVVLFTLNEMGLVGEPEWLSLPSTPMHKVAITDPASELPSLGSRVPDRATALVHVTVTLVPGGPTRGEMDRAIRNAFPRHTEIVWTRAETTSESGDSNGISAGADYRETVRRFLSNPAVVPDSDADKQALLALAESFFTAEAVS